jgi:Uma2 family endonuclease
MFTTDEFHRMAQAGILAEDDRVELIDGEVVRMSPIGSRHASCVDRLNAFFTHRLGARAIVRVQSPILLNRRSEPQPDLALLKPRGDFYATRHPGPADVLLVVEVIDSSAEYDRALKLPLYARASIAEVWLIDLVRNDIEVYRRPALRAYRDQQTHARGEHLTAAAFPRTRFRVSELLG